jgi:hypothetical protein
MGRSFGRIKLGQLNLACFLRRVGYELLDPRLLAIQGRRPSYEGAAA